MLPETPYSPDADSPNQGESVSDVVESSRKARVQVRVALIEDDAPLRRIIAGWLRQPGQFEVVRECADAESALALLPAVRPDVVLADIHLPGMSGIECVRRLKPQMAQTQFVMLTVYEDTQRIFKALAAGATGYLLKRASARELLEAVAAAHRGESPMSGNIARKVVASFQRNLAQASEAAPLGPREQQILDLLAQGFLYKEIAAKLGVSLFTVNAHIRSVYEKLHVHSRSQAVAKYLGM
jgi:DNA-binding NarL/FixJ family response regulator